MKLALLACLGLAVVACGGAESEQPEPVDCNALASAGTCDVRAMGLVVAIAGSIPAQVDAVAGALTTACGALAGLPPADASDAGTACGLASATLPMIGLERVTPPPPACGYDTDAQLGCEATCAVGATCGSSDWVSRCAKVVGMCNGACAGACTAGIDGSSPCAGACHGACTGTCDGQAVTKAACEAECEGECEGACDATPPAVVCVGVCGGQCDGEMVELRCGDPLTQPSCDSCFDCVWTCRATAFQTASCFLQGELGFNFSPNASLESASLVREQLPAVVGACAEVDRLLSALSTVSQGLTALVDPGAGDDAEASVTCVVGAVYTILATAERVVELHEACAQILQAGYVL